MNGIDELRATLGTHADDVRDLGDAERGAAVHGRVRAVRRRRVGATAAAALAAVVAGVLLVPGGDDGPPDPAGPVVFGIDVPKTQTSLGFTYDYERHVRGEGRVKLTLADSTTPRLVSWATSGDDGQVSVVVGAGNAPLVTDGPDFGDWTYVAPGDGTTVSARAREGDIALAVYTLGQGRPEGIGADGVTYRETEAGARLLGATIGKPGQSEIVVEPAGRAESVTLHYLCAGGPSNSFVHIDEGAGVFGIGAAVSRCPSTRLTPHRSAGRSEPAGISRRGCTSPGGGAARWLRTLAFAWDLVSPPSLPAATSATACRCPRRSRRTATSGAWSEPPPRRSARRVRPPTCPSSELDGRGLAVIADGGTGDTYASYRVAGQQGPGSSASGGGSFTALLAPGAPSVSLTALRRGRFPAGATAGFGFYVRAD